MVVRVADKGDVGSLVALSRALFLEDGGTRDSYMDVEWPVREGAGYFGGVISSPGCLCLVVEASDEVAGYLVGRMREGDALRPVRVADLESMYVRGGLRGRGVGSNLVREFFGWASRCKAERVSVTAYAENEAALRFYRRHGFVSRSVTLEGGVPQDT